MNDHLLNRGPRIHHWQSTEMLYVKPWNFARRHQATTTQSFNFRPSEPSFPMPYAAYPSSNYSPGIGFGNKPIMKDHYFLAPYYRNAMPPPPNPNRLMLADQKARKQNVSPRQITENCYCNNRSRSLEDVRTEVIELSDWSDFNAPLNRLKPNANVYERPRAKPRHQRSMDNLLDDNNNYVQSSRIYHEPQVARQSPPQKRYRSYGNYVAPGKPDNFPHQNGHNAYNNKTKTVTNVTA